MYVLGLVVDYGYVRFSKLFKFPAKSKNIVSDFVCPTSGTEETMSDAPAPKPEGDDKADTTTITIRVRDQVRPHGSSPLS